MPRSLIKLVLILIALAAIGLFAVVYFFGSVDGRSDRQELSLSEFQLQERVVSLCLDERILTPEDGYIDFSQAPSAELAEFEAFARNYSNYFLPKPTNAQDNGAQKSAAKRCKDISRPREKTYVFGAGSGPSRAAYNALIEDGYVVHIDGFFINNE